MKVAVISACYPKLPWENLNVLEFLPHGATKILLCDDDEFSHQVQLCANVLGIPSAVYPLGKESQHRPQKDPLFNEADLIVVVWDGTTDAEKHFLTRAWNGQKPVTLHRPRKPILSKNRFGG